MRHVKSEFDKLSFKEILTYSLAVACMIAATVAIFLGMYIPPEGEVHSSILTYFGISSAFVGTLLGVSMHYSNELQNFKSSVIDSIAKARKDDPDGGDKHS